MRGRPCEHVAYAERLLLPDGTEELVGDPPPALCDDCPEHQMEEPPVRHVTVVRDYRGRHYEDEAAPPPPAEPVAEPVAVLPAEPVAEAEDPYFALQRQQAWEDEQERKALRRRGPGGPSLKPEDFGLRP